MDKQINTGVIGFGLSGKVFHAPFIHTHRGFNLKKIVERNSRESVKIYPYVEIVSDYKKLTDDKSIELIVVCTPNTLHYSMVKESLLSGKHVVVEKPFTPTLKEAEELIEIAKKVDKKIFVFHNRRWDGDFLTIKKILKNNLLGDLFEYEAHFDRYKPDVDADAWRNIDIPGGGILFDLGSHLIDQALHLFGRPSNIKSDIRNQRKGSNVDDFFRLEFQYPNLKVVLTSGMLVKEIGPRYILKGDKGIFTKFGIDPQEDALKKGLMPVSENWGCEKEENWGIFKSVIDAKEIKIETMPGNYMAFYDNVYDVIINNNEMKIKPEEARDVIEIIESSLIENRN